MHISTGIRTGTHIGTNTRRIRTSTSEKYITFVRAQTDLTSSTSLDAYVRTSTELYHYRTYPVVLAQNTLLLLVLYAKVLHQYQHAPTPLPRYANALGTKPGHVPCLFSDPEVSRVHSHGVLVQTQMH